MELELLLAYPSAVPGKAVAGFHTRPCSGFFICGGYTALSMASGVAAAERRASFALPVRRQKSSPPLNWMPPRLTASRGDVPSWA
jgi:hypothetical protein